MLKKCLMTGFADKIDTNFAVQRSGGMEPMRLKPEGAARTGQYENVFARYGYDPEEIEARRRHIFDTLFYGPEDQRLYHETGGDMAYFEDTGNHDVRTEGMSYAMMMCVQMDRKAEFDRLWRWAKTYMYLADGPNAGYFAWSCGPDGEKNSYGAAPDGEEYFAMALFFAAHRWGNGDGIFNYEAQAREILRVCLHQGEDGNGGHPMWDPDNHLIRFVAEADFSDPSYHLPHFYELFSQWSGEEDRAFWREAARCSRAYWQRACHPETGLSAEYANYSGTPRLPPEGRPADRHDWYYSDAYRTILNIAVDAAWFGATPWAVEEARRLQRFFCTREEEYAGTVYEIDGTPVSKPALHPVAITATNAAASLLHAGGEAERCLRRFWDTPLRTGDRRYYDNCLYFFSYLLLSGNYRIY